MGFYFYFEPEDYSAIREWCTEEFGPINKNWAMAGNNDIGGEIWFRLMEDAMAFKLAWS